MKTPTALPCGHEVFRANCEVCKQAGHRLNEEAEFANKQLSHHVEGQKNVSAVALAAFRLGCAGAVDTGLPLGDVLATVVQQYQLIEAQRAKRQS